MSGNILICVFTDITITNNKLRNERKWFNKTYVVHWFVTEILKIELIPGKLGCIKMSAQQITFLSSWYIISVFGFLSYTCCAISKHTFSYFI